MAPSCKIELARFSAWLRIQDGARVWQKSPEIDRYHYQGASPAPMCVHSPASNIEKGPYEQSVTSEPSVGGGLSAPVFGDWLLLHNSFSSCIETSCLFLDIKSENFGQKIEFEFLPKPPLERGTKK